MLFSHTAEKVRSCLLKCCSFLLDVLNVATDERGVWGAGKIQSPKPENNSTGCGSNWSVCPLHFFLGNIDHKASFGTCHTLVSSCTNSCYNLARKLMEHSVFIYLQNCSAAAVIPLGVCNVILKGYSLKSPPQLPKWEKLCFRDNMTCWVNLSQSLASDMHLLRAEQHLRTALWGEGYM